MRDVKEPIGIIMRMLDHGEIAEADVVDLAFDAEGELLAAVNAACIKLLEFAHDRELRCADADLGRFGNRVQHPAGGRRWRRPSMVLSRVRPDADCVRFPLHPLFEAHKPDPN